MDLKLSKNRIKIFITENFFWLIFAGYFVSLFMLNFSIVILISFLVIICYGINLTSKSIGKIDITVIYMIYVISTIVLYSINGRPKSLYIKGIAYIIIPMMLYFIPKDRGKIFWKKTFDAIFFSILAALVLYIWPKPFYAEYLYLHGFTGSPLVDWIRPSLIQGVFGITITASLSACAFIYYWWQVSYKVKYSLLKCLLCLGMLVYNRRRAAMLSAVIVFIIENIILYCKRASSGKRTAYIFVFVILLCISAIIFEEQVGILWERYTNVSSAFNERSSAWTENVEQMGINSLFGYGLGSSSHIAIAAGFDGVADGQYAFMLVETGIIGFFLFICVVSNSFIKSVRNRDDSKYISMLIVLLFLLQGAGSNILEFPVLGCLFWYSLSQMQGTRRRYLDYG